MQIDDKEFFEQVVNKLDEVAKDISEIKVILEKQQGELNMHMYRTDLAEKSIEKLAKRISPLETKNNYLDGGLKLVGTVSAISGFLWVLIQIVKSLNI